MTMTVSTPLASRGSPSMHPGIWNGSCTFTNRFPNPGARAWQ